MWGFLGSLASGLVSGLLGIGGSHAAATQQQQYTGQNLAKQHKYNLAAMKQAQKYNKELATFNQGLTMQNLQTAPGALRKGMENAGFNPVLAYTNGSFSNASAPGSSQALGVGLAQSPSPDYSGAVSNAFQSAMQVRNLVNQNRMTEAQVANTNADTEYKKTLASTESAKQIMMNDQREYIWTQSELNRLDAELRRKDISWYEYKQQREDYLARLEEIRSRAAETSARAATLNSYTNAEQVDTMREKNAIERINANTRKYEAITNRYKETHSGSGNVLKIFGGSGSVTKFNDKHFNQGK